MFRVLIIELFIIFFIRFQIFEGLSLDNEKLFLKKKNQDEIFDHDETNQYEDKNILKGVRDEDVENTLDIFQIIEKGKNFMGSVKPYLNRREQYYIDIFTKIAEILECHRQLVEYQNDGTEVQEDNFDQVGILKAVKPYMKEDKQVIIDKFIKLYEGIQNLNEKMKKYEMEENKNNVIDKILDIFEALKPVIPDDKQDMAEKIIKNIKLVEALNKAESIMNSKNSADKKSQQDGNRRERENILALPPKNDSAKENDNLERAESNLIVENDEKELNENVETPSSDIDIKYDNYDSDTEKNENQGLTSQQSAVVDSLKSMLTKEQQQFMYNMINYLKQQSATNNTSENDKSASKDVDGAGD